VDVTGQVGYPVFKRRCPVNVIAILESDVHVEKVQFGGMFNAVSLR
jgi:hypothetical protein